MSDLSTVPPPSPLSFTSLHCCPRLCVSQRFPRFVTDSSLPSRATLVAFQGFGLRPCSICLISPILLPEVHIFCRFPTAISTRETDHSSLFRSCRSTLTLRATTPLHACRHHRRSRLADCLCSFDDPIILARTEGSCASLQRVCRRTVGSSYRPSLVQCTLPSIYIG